MSALDQIIADSGRYYRPNLRLEGCEQLPLSIPEFKRLLAIPHNQLTEDQDRALTQEHLRRNVIGMYEHYEQRAKISIVVVPVIAVVAGIFYCSR